MSGGGATVSDRMVFVASGFTVTAGMPGNVVLAFELPPRSFRTERTNQCLLPQVEPHST